MTVATLTSTGFPPEIAFLAQHAVDGPLLTYATLLAEHTGTDAATAMLQAGLMSEDQYYRSLADALGLPFLDGPIRFGAGLRYPDCLVAGLAPLAPGEVAAQVIAPRGAEIADWIAGHRGASRPALTSPTRLREAVFATFPGAVAGHAAEGFRLAAPGTATAANAPGRPLLMLALCLSALICLALAAPRTVTLSVVVLGQILALALITIRIAAAAVPVIRAEAEPLSDAELPVYTVLVPLFEEARVVPRLLFGLASLDYPAAKLDIKILIEADDAETAEALSAFALPARFEILTVPPGLPRTKPRALNVALPLARGSLLVIYDAEDVPERDQLRKAAALFACAPPDVACFQGHLVIDDHGDGLLPKLFAAEYAGLFEVVNPALAALGLPILLGGTSSHMRTAVVRSLRGWDPYNVTEDADLGLRFALAGYRVRDLPSATFEETPSGWTQWLRQRSRWLKGFLQTSLVHGRKPGTMMSRLGLVGTLCVLALVPGSIVSALAYPIGFLGTLAVLVLGRFDAASTALGTVSVGLAATLFLAGLAALIAPAALGCQRRGWPDLWPLLPLLPFYFCLVGIAALRAVGELVHAPYRWNKTEHGLSRSSRSGMLAIGRPQRNARSAR